MRNSLVWVGAVMTVAYLIGLTALIWDRLPNLLTMELNSLGDFFAGGFGPIAFLWLVLGFLQQGQELRLSSDALRMQADELKASVEQQTALVEAQRVMLENHARSLEPLLQIYHVGNVEDHGEFRDVFEVINHGAYCRNVIAEFLGRGMAMPGVQVPALGKDSPKRFKATSALPYGQVWKLKLSYEKSDGQENSQSFGMTKRLFNGLDVYAVVEDKAFVDDIDV